MGLDAICTCGFKTESVEPYLLYCNDFEIQRNNTFNDINNLCLPVTIVLLLFGDDVLHIDDNLVVFSSVQKYIKDNKRFPLWQPLICSNQHLIIKIFT